MCLTLLASVGMLSSSVLIPLVAMTGYRLPEAWILLRTVGFQLSALAVLAALMLALSSSVARVRMLPLSLLVLWLYPLAQPPLLHAGIPESAAAIGAGVLAVAVVLVPHGVISRLAPWASTAEQFGIGAAAVGVVLAASLYWQQSREGLPADVVERMTQPIGLSSTAERPDIYHIILDGLGRPDALRERYGVDTTRELSRLRSLGFSVGEDVGLTNYTQTYHVLASMLNMRYLDGLPGELRDRSSREPMHDLVQNASVIRSLKAIGYELDVIAGTAQLRWHPEADRCECDYPWIGLFESQVILRSPLHVFPWHDLQHRLHRTHAVGTFDGLEAYQPEGPPRLLLAHVMLPHAPFVVGPDGEPRSPDRMFSFAEGPLWEGTGEEYRQGYADQTRYTVRRSVAIAERLIETARSSGRSAIVILHGDHGPRAPVNGGRVPFDADELFPVFLAIRGAGALPEIETTRVSTLVNLYRVILSEYFGADLRPLPNESFMSSFGRPYDFKSVDLRGLQ